METRIERPNVCTLIKILLGFPLFTVKLVEFSNKLPTCDIKIDFSKHKKALNQIIYSFLKVYEDKATYEYIASVLDEMDLDDLKDLVLQERDRVNSDSFKYSDSNSIRFEEFHIKKITNFLITKEEFCSKINKFAKVLKIPENDMDQMKLYDPKKKLNRILNTLFQKFPKKSNFNTLAEALHTIGLIGVSNDFVKSFGVTFSGTDRLEDLASQDNNLITDSGVDTEQPGTCLKQMYGSITIKTFDTSKSYEQIFGTFLNGNVKKVFLQDPYIRNKYQLNNLQILIKLIWTKCPKIQHIELRTGITERTDKNTLDELSLQKETLEKLQKSMKFRTPRIIFKYSIDINFHDRKLIIYDNEYVCRMNLGKGLDYFNICKEEEPEWNDQNLRICQETEIVYQYERILESKFKNEE